MRFTLFSITLFLVSSICQADTQAVQSSYFAQPADDQVYSQFFSLSVGPFNPRSAVISNESYSFDYGSSSNHAVMVQAGWSARLFWLLGAVYFNENFNYSQLSGAAPSGGVTGGADQSLTVNLFGLDTRLVHAWEWFPVKWAIPFVEGGYEYTFYNQAGSVDLDSVQGGVGNPVAGAGMRFWLNRGPSESEDSVHRHNQLPIFLTVKWNRIFANNSGGLDLAESSYLGGVSIGL
jgi:hypothetical protein